MGRLSIAYPFDYPGLFSSYSLMNVQELTLVCINANCRRRLTVRVKLPTKATTVKCPNCGQVNPLPTFATPPPIPGNPTPPPNPSYVRKRPDGTFEGGYQANPGQPADESTLLKHQQDDETLLRDANGPKPPLPEILGWLIVHDEKTKTQNFNLKKGFNSVGRLSQQSPSDLMIETNDRYMSRPHCTVEVKISKMGVVEYVLQDGAIQPDGSWKNSRNGTFLNGQEPALHPSERIYLKDGDTIQLGETKVVLKTFQMSESLQKAYRQVEGTDYTRTILSFT